MSDNIPFEIQEEIIKKLTIKSLIQFRSVSKAWKALIEASDFIAGYSSQQMQPLVVMYKDRFDYKQKYISLADDDQRAFLTAPLLAKKLSHCCIIGSSRGLLCLYGENGTGMAVIWNPSIRKAVSVVVPNVAHGIYGLVLGFGVCGDAKIVKIRYIEQRRRMGGITRIPWQVEVYTLRTKVWRCPYGNLPRISIQFHGSVVNVDDFLYWLANDRITVDGGFSDYSLIMLFDMTSDEFKEVKLPDILAQQPLYNLSISKLKESLVLHERGGEDSNHVFIVWMMEDGFPKTFTKLFTFNVNVVDAIVRGFRNNGEPLIEISEDGVGMYSLVVYEPTSGEIRNLGIDVIYESYSVFPYMETLLLLDQPNCTFYNEMETLRVLDDLVGT